MSVPGNGWFGIFLLVWLLLFPLGQTRATPQTSRPIFDVLTTFPSTFVSSGAGQREFTAEDALGVRTFALWARMALSPDGRWLAYTVQDNSHGTAPNDAPSRYFTPTGAPATAANCDIWLTDTTTGKSKNLTQEQGTNWDPVWSPNGKYLAFYSDRGGVARVWVWERGSGQSRQISDAIERSSHTTLVRVSWMPDSRHIVAKVLPAGMTLEHATNIDGSPPQAMLANPGKGTTVTVYRSIPVESTGKHGLNSSKRARVDKNIGEFGLYAGDLALIDVVTGKTLYLTTDIHPVNFWISPDGQNLAYTDFKGRPLNEEQALYDLGLYSFTQRSSRILVPDIKQEMGMSVSWSPNGRLLAYITNSRSDPADSHPAQGDCLIVPIEGGNPRSLTKGVHPPFGGLFSVPLWDKGESLYLTVSDSSIATGLINPASDTIWKASVREGTVTKFARIPGHSVLGLVAASSGEVIWSPDGGQSLVVGTQDETTRQAGFWKVDLASGKASKLFEDRIALSSPRFFALSTEVSRDGNTVTYFSEDAQHPQAIWSAGSDFRHRHRLADLNPGLEGISFGVSQPIEYRSLDGILLHGALLLPAAYEEGKRYPMIVWVYSGSFMSREVYRFGLESSTASLNLQILASHGYAVLVADAPLNVGTPVLDLMKAVMPAVDRVVDMGIADPERLGIMGHSYGGYSTLALIEQTSRFKAAVAYAGLYDLISAYGSMDQSGAGVMTGWLEGGQGRMEGSPWQFRDRYIENSPIFHLDRIQTPLLLVHGGVDSVPFQQAEEVFVGLRRLGKDVVYAKYGGEGHTLTSPANIVDFWNRVSDWFDEHLKLGPLLEVPPSASGGNPE